MSAGPNSKSYETFKLHTHPDGSNGIESVSFPDCYIGVDGDKIVGQYCEKGKEPVGSSAGT